MDDESERVSQETELDWLRYPRGLGWEGDEAWNPSR